MKFHVNKMSINHNINVVLPTFKSEYDAFVCVANLAWMLQQQHSILVKVNQFSESNQLLFARTLLANL